MHVGKLNRLRTPCGYARQAAMDIRTARKALNLTQAELAAMLGVNHSAISRYETGAVAPDKRTLIALNAIFEQAKAA